jgi:pyruvate formate lyase activating enzyme
MIDSSRPPTQPSADSSSRPSDVAEVQDRGMVEGVLQVAEAEGVRCGVCTFRCVVPEGTRGRCGTRLSAGGRLYSLVYGVVGSISPNPIEKKPVYHYLPGSTWLSVGTYGCNFRCPGCQNWDLAHREPLSNGARYERLSPEQLADAAVQMGCKGVSWTFNEPAVWLEYVADGAMAARRRGLRTNVVTNGSLTAEALDILGPHLDVYRVDVKGFSSETYRRLTGADCLQGVLEGVSRAKGHWGMHVEVVTNVIPGISDDPGELAALAAWIRSELGADTPWHLTRFFPAHRLSASRATPVPLLEATRSAALDRGLRFVYLGNVPGHPAENTWCPACGELLIARAGLGLDKCCLRDGCCPVCGQVIPGRFSETRDGPL